MCILFTEVHNYTNLNTKLISYSSDNDVTGSDNGVTGSECRGHIFSLRLPRESCKKKQEIYSCIIKFRGNKYYLIFI